MTNETDLTLSAWLLERLDEDEAKTLRPIAKGAEGSRMMVSVEHEDGKSRLVWTSQKVMAAYLRVATHESGSPLPKE